MNLGLCGSWDIYPIEYMWTKAETKLTTTNITADNASILIDQFTFKVPELIHEAIIKLFEYPLLRTLKKTKKDNNAEIDTNKLVKISEVLSPILLPKKPTIIEAVNGKNKI